MGIRFISQIDLFQCSTHVFNKDSCRACGSYLIPHQFVIFAGNMSHGYAPSVTKWTMLLIHIPTVEYLTLLKKGHKENKDYIIYNSLCDYLGIP